MRLLCCFGFHDWQVKWSEHDAYRPMFEYCDRCPKTRPYRTVMWM